VKFPACRQAGCRGHHKNMLNKIPIQVQNVLTELEKNNFESYIVGGCVRDLLLGKNPKDWDVTTNAKPEEVQKIFVDSFYENKFGTVGVKVEPFMKEGKEGREHDVIEVTTYRIESKYSDKRHPDEVRFAETLKEDLSRRDFTVNALALKIVKGKTEIVDLFSGQKDLEKKIIRTVGKAEERFDEDALRMMRAIRFQAQLGFSIEEKTLEAIKKNAKNLESVSEERIKDELVKIILSDNPSEGMEMLHETGLLPYIIPELEKGYGVKQNRHHIYTIYKHSILALKYCPSNKLEVRLASLFHDIAKPQTNRSV